MMFGTYGTFTALPGKRDELCEIIRQATGPSKPMPGCLTYVVYTLADEPDKVGVFEVWESREAHRASLKLDNVRGLIEKAMPLIAGPPESTEIDPVGAFGLSNG